MTLQELVTKSGTPELCDRLKALEEEAQFGRECREAMVAETVALGLLLDFGADEATLQKAFSALDSRQLRTLKAAMAQKAAVLFPPEAQLPRPQSLPNKLEDAYII